MARTLFIYIFILFGSLTLSFGQEKITNAISDSTDFSNYSLDELTQLKSKYASTDLEKTINQAIDVASHKPMNLRKSASIITIITDDEIEKTGARDLMDILRMVPGIEFNVDVEGVVAISFRGLWANEGNLLLQIDGQEMNETAYSGLAFGNHYPLDQIKRIEVVRGPGSAMHGGCAEYAVINIVTKKGDDLKGLNANLILGQTASSYARQDVGLSLGNKINDFSYSLNGLIGRGQRSDLVYTDIYQKSFNMNGNGDLTPQFLNINLGYKGLSVLFMYDNYSTTTRDGYINALSRAYPCDFASCMAELKYIKKINKKLQFQTKFNYKHSVPWTFDGQVDPIDSSNYGYYKIEIDRYRLNLFATWDPNFWLNAILGVEGYYDACEKMGGLTFSSNNASEINYINYAPYAQLLIKTNFAFFTFGARYDISAGYGNAFNPRLGINKKAGIFNFKLLYASSFRAPSIENIDYEINNIKLKPETSKTFEFETGVKLSKNMYLSVNIFDITTTNAIRYFVRTDSVVGGEPDGYRNTNKVIGSQGLELEYRFKTTFGFVNMNYSFYTIGNKGVDSANLVSLDRNTTLGTAQNKFSVVASFNVGKHLFISPSANYLGKRYGYASVDALGNGILSVYDPQIKLNLYIGSLNLVKNVSMGLGVSNITNQRIDYLQAYNSLHGALPGLGREFYFKLSYNFSFTKTNATK